jgi:hypothetical protein
MTNPFGPSPFQPNPFGAGAPGPHPAPQPTPGPPRDEANVLATLSVVFAFVFAPAGLILGHLGLAQIRHTGQRGRERALVGVTLSYVFITALVIALIVAAMMPEAKSIQAAAPTPTTTQPPPTPTVAPSAMDGLLADVTAVVGYSELVFSGTNDPHNMWDVGEGVSSFHDVTAAQGQLGKLQAGWRQCGGSTVRETWPEGRTYQVTIAAPADAGNGITTIETVTDFPAPDFGGRAIAAKTNVVIGVGAWSTPTPTAPGTPPWGSSTSFSTRSRASG